MWGRNFFVRAAPERLLHRWQKVFDLCWLRRGFTCDVSKVPDWVLDEYLKDAAERLREEASEMPDL
jgi:hypothetical protein